MLFISSVFVNANAGERAVGTLGEPNSLSATMLFILPFCLLSKQNKRNILLLLIGIVTIFLTGSRSGIIGLGVELFFFFLQKYFSLYRTAFICFFLLLLTLFLPFLQTKNVYENRAEVWKTAWAAGLQKPLLGWGIGNTPLALKETALKETNNLRFQIVDSSHNLFLDWFVQTGAVGLILFLFLLSQAVLGLIRTHKSKTLGSFLGIMSVLLFNPVSVVTLIAFWWIMGRGFSATSE